MRIIINLIVVFIFTIIPIALVGLWRVYIVYLDTNNVVKEWSNRSLKDILTTPPNSSVFWIVQIMFMGFACIAIFWGKIRLMYQKYMVIFGDVIDHAEEEHISWWHIPITVRKTLRLSKVRAYFPGVDNDGPGAEMNWQSTAGREQFGVKEITLRPGKEYRIPFIVQRRPTQHTNFDGSAYLTPETDRSWDQPRRDHIPLGDIRPITLVVESGDGRFKAFQTYQVNVPNSEEINNSDIRIEKIRTDFRI